MNCRSVGRAMSVVALLAWCVIVMTSLQSAAQTPQRGGVTHMVHGPFGALNPLSGSTQMAFISGQLWASLTRMDDNWNVQPYLAKSWDISSDGLTYTFHVVEGATFHDGKPITSEDVAFSIMTVKNFHRFGATMLGPVKAVETPNAHTVVIRLSEPHGPLLLSTSAAYFLPIMPKHIYGQGDINKHPADAAPIGSGPFKFTEMRPDEYLILERHDGYFLKGRPYLDRIVLHVTRDPNADVLGFEKGNFHLSPLTSIGLRDLERLRNLDHVDVVDVGQAIGPPLMLEVNHRRPPLNNVLVRKAIAHAIDVDFVAKTLHRGWTRRGTGPIYSGTPYYSKDVPIYEFDLDKANRLLDEAKLPRGANGIRFTTTLMESTAFPPPDFAIPLNDYIVSQLGKIGIRVERARVPDYATWAQRSAAWEFDMTLNSPGTYIDPVIGVSRTYVCDNIKHVAFANVSGYCNREIDALFEKAAHETSPAQRKATYAELQRKIVDDLAVIWLLERPLPTVYNADLGNPPIHAWGAIGPLDEMYWKKNPRK